MKTQIYLKHQPFHCGIMLKEHSSEFVYFYLYVLFGYFNVKKKPPQMSVLQLSVCFLSLKLKTGTQQTNVIIIDIPDPK